MGAGDVGFTSTNIASVITTIHAAAALSGVSATVVSFTPTAVGTYTITGSYTGAIGDIAASSGTASLTVTKYIPTLAYTQVISTQTYSTAITAAALNATAAWRSPPEADRCRHGYGSTCEISAR